MATKLARRFGRPIAGPRRPSPLIAKLRDKLRAAGRRAREGGGGARGGMMRDVVAAAGAAGLGKLEQSGMLPARLGPIDSALVVGALGAFVAPRFVKGKVGQLVHDATLGALCVGAYRLGQGAPFLGEDGLEGGGWSDVT